ncbi:MAG: YtxH domain-containing protein [Gemmatimonadetes bacterium]|nr:YtxH domain-containing protein [Gemmatimonadota bacterium]
MTQHDDPPYVFIERRSGGVGSFLLGILIGAGLGILFAPRSGEETRGEIRENARRLGKQAEDALRQVQGAVGDTIDGVRQSLGDRVDAARDAFESGRRAARETRDDMERRVRDAKDRVRAGIDAARKPPGAPEPPDLVEEPAAEGKFGD